jgi:AraC-like DNA-binding protein
MAGVTSRVIDLNNRPIDPPYGDYTQLLRAPDLRMLGLSWEHFRTTAPFVRDFPEARRSCFYYVLKGAAFFRTGPRQEQLHYVTRGTTIGVERYRHQWLDYSHIHPREVRRLSDGRAGPADLPLELIVSSIDRSSAVLQRLPYGAIVIPVDARPFADTIRGCVELIELDRMSGMAIEGVARRLTEVIMLQLIAWSRSSLWRNQSPKPEVLHDEFLLRAMTAFFGDPGQNWTVEALATAAGLSRTAFSERFRKAFADTPLKAINRLRLQLAADILKRSNASLARIADEVGFGSAPALVRAFTREYGKTPGQWRIEERR